MYIFKPINMKISHTQSSSLIFFLFASLLFASGGFAQRISFEKILPTLPTPITIAEFEGIDFGKVIFADVDGDNDEDLWITVIDSLGIAITVLYVNDSLESFSPNPTNGVLTLQLAELNKSAVFQVMISVLN